MAFAGLVVLLVVVLAGLVAFAALTALGERRRGGSPAVALVAGVFFPLTWMAWYVRDAR
ncbi:hypothetical protein [Nocardioides conyzicola]|uniref:Cardiolipin synthase N-terminal domain-containing protein n=1 Tax=Nocardioides conyzicola TaxID=1651781 RepID=A0ABP8Y0M5_9ACTN